MQGSECWCERCADAAKPREGRFVIGGESYPLSLLRLPCVVESFKTYDDINLVKSADVGEVCPLQCPALFFPCRALCWCPLQRYIFFSCPLQALQAPTVTLAALSAFPTLQRLRSAPRSP